MPGSPVAGSIRRRRRISRPARGARSFSCGSFSGTNGSCSSPTSSTARVICHGPSAYVAHPVWHLDAVLNPAAKRRARRRRTSRSVRACALRGSPTMPASTSRSSIPTSSAARSRRRPRGDRGSAFLPGDAARPATRTLHPRVRRRRERALGRPALSGVAVPSDGDRGLPTRGHARRRAAHRRYVRGQREHDHVALGRRRTP